MKGFSDSLSSQLRATEDEQIKEIVGSGPFKLANDEWQPGEQVVYVRNPDYIPRDETPSGSTGGKRVYLDKVIWRYTPDPFDAADDLAAGTPRGSAPSRWWSTTSRDIGSQNSSIHPTLRD